MSGHCDFCGIWHSGSCCHPGRALLVFAEAERDELKRKLIGYKMSDPEFPSCDTFEPGGSRVAPGYYCRHCGNRAQDHPHPSREGASHEEAPSCEKHGVMVPDNESGTSWHCAACDAVVPRPRPEPARYQMVYPSGISVAAAPPASTGVSVQIWPAAHGEWVRWQDAKNLHDQLTTCTAEREAAQKEVTLLHAANKDLLQSWDAENEKRHDAEEDLETAQQELQKAVEAYDRLNADFDAFLADHGHDGCAVTQMQIENKLAALRASLTAVAQEMRACRDYPVSILEPWADRLRAILHPTEPQP